SQEAMPIIFVHGVNTRRSEPGYDARIGVVDRLLRLNLNGATIGGAAVPSTAVVFPYWGDLATQFAWDMASLPAGAVNALGGAVDPGLRPLIAVVEDGLADAASAGDQPLLTVAKKRSLGEAMDIVSELLLQNAPPVHAAQIADFVVVAQRYADANPSPP